jgi:cob(I)alamin adenosyltransferase
VSRRAERLMVEMIAETPGAVSAEALAYVNRLSDFFFVAARWVNDLGRADVLWVPGANR